MLAPSIGNIVYLATQVGSVRPRPRGDLPYAESMNENHKLVCARAPNGRPTSKPNSSRRSLQISISERRCSRSGLVPDAATDWLRTRSAACRLETRTPKPPTRSHATIQEPMLRSIWAMQLDRVSQTGHSTPSAASRCCIMCGRRRCRTGSFRGVASTATRRCPRRCRQPCERSLHHFHARHLQPRGRGVVPSSVADHRVREDHDRGRRDDEFHRPQAGRAGMHYVARPVP